MATWFDNSLVAGQTLIARFNGIATALGLLAPKANPTFTGTVTAPAFSGSLTGNVTGNVSGNAGSATVLQTARNINGVSFNGSAAVSVNTVNSLSAGTYLTGSAFNGGAAVTWAVDATSNNTAAKVVARDASGNFSATTITANLAGNASTATTLQFARSINGVDFNGSAPITITAVNPNALTRGAYLTGSNYSGAATTTWAVDASASNLPATVVARDASGNFSASAITANLTGTVTGNASTATALAAGGADRFKLDGIASGATANSTDVQLRDRTTHTGAQAISTITGLQTALDAKAPLASPTFTGTVTGTFSGNVTGNASTATALSVGTDRTKLDGIQAGATANSSDAALIARANHTGTQAISTVANLQTALDAKAPLASPTFTGTATAPTFSGALTGNVTGNVSGTTVTTTGATTAGRLVLTAGATLTIAAGVITVTASVHAVDTEGATATDDLMTINGGTAGQILILRAANDTRDVVLKDNTGNLRLVGDFTLISTNDRIVLMYDGTFWLELSRSLNV